MIYNTIKENIYKKHPIDIRQFIKCSVPSAFLISKKVYHLSKNVSAGCDCL